MFMGTFEPKLDDKGRLVIPAKFREAFANGLVVAKGQERCLNVWTTAEFERYREQVGKLSVTNPRGRQYVRMLFSGAHDEVPDKQGRINLPQRLIEYAGLSRDCVVIGANNWVEIWSAQRWAEWMDAEEGNYADLDEDIFAQFNSHPS